MPAMEQKGLDFGGREALSAGVHRPATRRSLTVSQLTERIQGLVEVEFFDVWVEGEVSNLKVVGSGHWYFSLKDDTAQIRAVVWKTATRLIRFRPKDGMKVLARGSVRLYPPRGEYQLSVEVVEPLGKGSLQQAFEELKERLQAEGLFDPKRKRPLPLLPRRIGIVTSPTGAVIQDILRVIAGRYANLEVVIYPARVQGAEAASEIVRGIRSLNRIRSLDVLVLARGGGNLEDLWPFNEEPVARAIAASKIPTISAVGHETDFTIADFVADVRAPTPSAAAERVIQAKEDIAARIDALARRLASALDLRMTRVRSRLAGLTSHRVFEAERGRLRGYAQRLDGLMGRAERGLRGQLERQRFRLRRCVERVDAFRWDRQVAQRRQVVRHQLERLESLTTAGLRSRRGALGGAAGKLDSLSPLSVLSRGYALVWDGRGSLVREPAEVQVGDTVRIRVHGGGLGATITSRERP
jgi:exodeoxyribonuclease VII large subunit